MITSGRRLLNWTSLSKRINREHNSASLLFVANDGLQALRKIKLGTEVLSARIEKKYGLPVP